MPVLHKRQLNSIFERIVTDKNGVLVRIRFSIIEVNGKLQGNIISATPLVTPREEAPVCLPVVTKTTSVYAEVSSFVETISPYFSLEFFMSQPTRAPSY